METTIIIEGLKAFWELLKPALIANVVPWFQGMLADWKIEGYEIKKGLETISTVFFGTLILWLGIDKGLGIDVEIASVGFSVAAVNWIWTHVPKLWAQFKARKYKAEFAQYKKS